ncbi:gamma-glutamyltranspeptidase [Ceraceosorus guamensis]|uniref:Glutathione hydrolase n=1 Tax=Ceraceosorus guamensis TaxID=1522189 RepID=A0A316VYD2_9BASI|nr:gamma-glutamyltranspeptidase [Ceraceosorus guamensis]PWN42667.1 gamma-glutamyltranspeptidase [Ceraceosorus guamensis]
MSAAPQQQQQQQQPRRSAERQARPISYPHPPQDQDAQETSPLLAHRTASERDRFASRLLKILLALAAFLLLLLIAIIIRQELKDRRDPRWNTGRRGKPFLAQGTHGAVASENVICSDIGVDILKAKGNAVDAAIASAFCIGTLNMFSSGIGGGGFMIVRDPQPCSLVSAETQHEGEASTLAHHRLPRRTHCASHTVIDFRETAPAASNKTMYSGRPGTQLLGGLAVGVPGEVAGLWEAHRRWGSMKWEELIQPSIKLAKRSIVGPQLAKKLKLVGGYFMLEYPEWSDIFVNPDTGILKAEGEEIRRPAYAKTLEKIAKHGPKAFYEGDVAKTMVEKVQSTGGILTEADLAAYKVVVRHPLTGRWGDRIVHTTPNPTCGPTLLSLLNIASLYPDWISSGPENADTVHRFVEASKFAFGQRTRLGDPAFLNSTAVQDVDRIPTTAEAARIKTLITNVTHEELSYYDPLFDIGEDHGTQHLSTVDSAGQAVALTSTVNIPFGSWVMDPATGVILNDEMDDTSTPNVPNAFGLRPSPFNYPEPGKRPLSSTAPTIVEHSDGSFFLALGGSGGSRIFGSVAQVLLNLDWGYDLSQAIERPRLHHQLLPAVVSAESTISDAILESLKSKGHNVTVFDINMGMAEVQAVMREQAPGRHARVFAASDSRKDGRASAY